MGLMAAKNDVHTLEGEIMAAGAAAWALLKLLFVFYFRGGMGNKEPPAFPG